MAPLLLFLRFLQQKPTGSEAERVKRAAQLPMQRLQASLGEILAQFTEFPLPLLITWREMVRSRALMANVRTTSSWGSCGWRQDRDCHHLLQAALSFLCDGE